MTTTGQSPIAQAADTIALAAEAEALGSRVEAATSSAAKKVARVEATPIQRVIYEDGSSDLTGLTERIVPGVAIVGGGTLPSPLTIEVAPLWTLTPPDAQCSKHNKAPRRAGVRPCSVCARIRVEAEIVGRVAQAFLAAGLKITVFDGEEDVTTDSESLGDVISACFGSDDDRFTVELTPGVRSWVQFIYGNDGFDVISDYTSDLEELLDPVMTWIDAEEAA